MTCAHQEGVISQALQTFGVTCVQLENDVFQWHQHQPRSASFTRGICASLGDIVRNLHASADGIRHRPRLGSSRYGMCA